MDDTLQVAKFALASFLHANPSLKSDTTFHVDFIRGFVAVYDAIDADVDPNRVESEVSGRGFDEGKRHALHMLAIND